MAPQLPEEIQQLLDKLAALSGEINDPNERLAVVLQAISHHSDAIEATISAILRERINRQL